MDTCHGRRENAEKRRFKNVVVNGEVSGRWDEVSSGRRRTNQRLFFHFSLHSETRALDGDHLGVVQ